EPFCGTCLLLVITCKFIGYPLWQLEFSDPSLFPKHFLGFLHHIHLCFTFYFIENYISNEERIFTLYHLCPAGVSDLCYLSQWYLCSGCSWYDKTFQLFWILSQLSWVAKSYWKSLTTFHRCR